MPNHPISGTNPGLPDVMAHHAQMFALSLRAEALSGALNSIIDDPDLNEASVAITEALSAILTKLVAGLEKSQRFEVTA